MIPKFRVFSRVYWFLGAALVLGTAVGASSAHAQVATVLSQPMPVLPAGDETVARIMKIRLEGGKASSWHMHPYPIYVFVVRGQAGLEFRGQVRQEFSAGQGWHEPARAVNRVVNVDPSEALELVMFQVSEAKAPFTQQAPAE